MSYKPSLNTLFKLQKTKVSKVKHNNQKKNKLVKKGTIKSQKPKPKPKKINIREVPPKNEKNAPIESEEESDYGEDMLGMVEEDDLTFLKNAITNKSYSILNKVRYTG